jgi:nesprin-1
LNIFNEDLISTCHTNSSGNSYDLHSTGEKLVEKAISMSSTVMKTTGTEGQDTLKQEIQQLKADWEGLRLICKDSQKILSKCIASWNDFADTFEKMKSWLDEFQKKVDAEAEGDKKTSEELQRCRVCNFSE